MRAVKLAGNILDTIWSYKRPAFRNRIISYHSISPDIEGSMCPEKLREHLEWLREMDYRSILIRDIPGILEKPKNEDKPWIAITFDDGYRDNTKFALPLLKEFGFCASFFIVTGMIGQGRPLNSKYGYKLLTDKQMMIVDDIIILKNAGMEIGSHTGTHKMAMGSSRLEKDELSNELVESKKKLEEIIDEEVVSFSYPCGQKGSFSEDTKKLIIQSGYRTSCTTIWGEVKRNTDIYELPRCDISADDDIDEFRAKISGQRDYHTIIQKTFKRSRNWQ